MRGQIFGLDAVIAVLVVAVGLNIFANVFHGVLETVSHDLLYRRIELTVDHAITTLLLADGPWRCKVNNVSVPGCVVEGTYPDEHNVFFLNDVNCELEGSSSLAHLLGCEATPPSNLDWIVVRDFNACITDSTPDKCVPKTLRLIVWVGQ